MPFARAGRTRAFPSGPMASQRNMGLMVAAMTGALPRTTWLYFALSQMPTCLSPPIVPALVRLRGTRLVRRCADYGVACAEWPGTPCRKSPSRAAQKRARPVVP